MSETIEALVIRARQLEEENALLRALQPAGHAAVPAAAAPASSPPPGASPACSPGDSPKAHAAPLAPAAPAVQAVDAAPRTLQEFRALPAERRTAAALAMTRRQRDEMLGRCPAGREGYL